MNIALIQLPHFYGNGLSRPPECYPLGLGYISNILSGNNIHHKGIDLWGMQFIVEEALEKTDFSGFDFFGISAYSTQYKYLKSISLKLKERFPNVPIICGGPGPTFSYEIILNNTGVDICVLGEGEITLIDLLHNYNRLDYVKSIAYLKGGNVFLTSPREYIANLDGLRFPNRELFDFEKIISDAESIRNKGTKQVGGDSQRRSADVIAGRGCPYDCFYCSKTFQGVRLRSIENLIKEVVELKQKYRINHLRFNDELVLVNKKRTLQLCEELKKLDMTWSCQGRINQVDKEILVAMKEAGCIEIGYGVESASQFILDRMNKKQKAETIVPVVKMTKEVGIHPIIQYMFGYPGESDETIAATIRFFKEIDHPYFAFVTTPIPGTELYQECLEKGLITNEEEYLMILDSGYNLDGTLVNMTDFSDREFLEKKRWLWMMSTHHYLKKRPVEYSKFLLGISKRKFVGLVKKVFNKISA